MDNIETELDRLRMLSDWERACHYVWRSDAMAARANEQGLNREHSLMAAWRMGKGSASLYRLAHEAGEQLIKQSARQEEAAAELLLELADAHWTPPDEVADEVEDQPVKRAVRKRKV